jgi:hypothetical protein
MKLLKEDPTETTRDILFVISQQLANNSLPPYQSVHYQTPQYAVIVNGLFFASLSCGLVVALVAVLALQWVANYDIGLNTSSPRKRALQRQLRWSGILKWKMAEVIAFLPLLIFVSLFLFFIGIADWLWHMNRAISGIVIGGIGVGCLFYAITTLISALSIDAPFRTPVSKSLALLIRETGSWAKALIVDFSVILVKEYRGAYSPWFEIQRIWRFHLHKPVPLKSFLRQEDRLVEGKKEASMESLLWLANSIEISPNSQVQLMALVKELMEVPAELLIQEMNTIGTPWEEIFTTLSLPYVNIPVDEWTGDEVQDAIDICKGLSIVPGPLSSQTLQAFVYSVRELRAPLAYTISSFTSAVNVFLPGDHFIRALTHAIKSNITAELGENYLYFILLNIQRKWDMIGGPGNRKALLESIGQLCAIPTDKIRDITPIPPFPIPSLRVIMNLVVHFESREAITPSRKRMHTLEARYITVARQLVEEDPEGSFHRVHCGIQRQLLARIYRVNPLSRSADNDVKALVELLLQISSCKTLALAREDRNSFISILTRSLKMPEVVDWLWSGLRATCEADEGLEDQFVAFILGLDDYLASKEALTGEYYWHLSLIVGHLNQVTEIGRNLISWRNQCAPWDKLSHIKDPCLAWWLMEWSPNYWQFRSLTQPDFSLLEDRADSLVFSIPRASSEWPPDSSVTFIRTLVIDGSPRVRELAMRILRDHIYWLSQKMVQIEIVSDLFFIVPSV